MRANVSGTAAARSMIIVLISFLAIAACDSGRGAEIFRNNRCPECHTVKGKGGKGGPDLSAVGARRSRDFIHQQIKDSKRNNPDTNMPSFKNLPEQDINDLADYLSRMK